MSLALPGSGRGEVHRWPLRLHDRLPRCDCRTTDDRLVPAVARTVTAERRWRAGAAQG